MAFELDDEARRLGAAALGLGAVERRARVEAVLHVSVAGPVDGVPPAWAALNSARSSLPTGLSRGCCLPRLLIGRVGEQHWSAVLTYRDGRARIISVRRSQTEELRIYGEDEG